MAAAKRLPCRPRHVHYVSYGHQSARGTMSATSAMFARGAMSATSATSNTATMSAGRYLHYGGHIRHSHPGRGVRCGHHLISDIS